MVCARSQSICNLYYTPPAAQFGHDPPSITLPGMAMKASGSQDTARVLHVSPPADNGWTVRATTVHPAVGEVHSAPLGRRVKLS